MVVCFHMPGRILIVDDEQGVRTVLTAFLESHGFTVWNAETIAEGLDILNRETIDFVLQDMMLSDGDGLDLLERIKTLRPELPVVIMTGSGCEGGLFEKAKEKGALDFISKMFSLNDLLTLIQNNQVKE